MGFTGIALVVGLVLGLVLGGRPRNVGLRPLRGSMALVCAVLLQAAPQLLDVSGTTGLACVLVSYAMLLVFALANVRLVGMPVVLLGLVLNIAVIGVNGGMPVRPAAIRTVDPHVKLAELDFGSKRHLETSDDQLTFLGDTLPVEPIGQVLSFGDLILSFGVADVVFRLLKPAGVVRRGRRRSVGDVLALMSPGDGDRSAQTGLNPA
jgi:hypothetical protein